MNYKQALQVSVECMGICTGDAYLASEVWALCAIHSDRGLNPEALYLGAKRAGHTGSSIASASVAELSRLMLDGLEDWKGERA